MELDDGDAVGFHLWCSQVDSNYMHFPIFSFWTNPICANRILYPSLTSYHNSKNQLGNNVPGYLSSGVVQYHVF